MQNKGKFIIIGILFSLLFLFFFVIPTINFFRGDSFKEMLESDNNVLTDDLKLVYSKGKVAFRGEDRLKIYKYEDETDFFDQFFLSENIFVIKRNPYAEEFFKRFETDEFKIPDEYSWDFEKDEYSSFSISGINIIHFKTKKQVVMLYSS